MSADRGPAAKSGHARRLRIREKDVQRACEDLLALDGWRAFDLEENFSEKKLKKTGERGAADRMLVRYGYLANGSAAVGRFDGPTAMAALSISEVIFIEWKAADGEAAAHQIHWHTAERARGAVTFIAGIDFPPTIEGFWAFYRQTGLLRKEIKL